MLKKLSMITLFSSLLLAFCCQIVVAQDATSSYQQEMEKLRADNPIWKELGSLFQDGEKQQKALESALEYNRQTRDHIRQAARQTRLNLAKAKDYIAREAYHVAGHKIAYVNNLKDESFADKREVEQDCAKVKKIDTYTLEVCHEELAEIDENIAEMDRLLKKYQQELNSQQ